MPILNFKPQFVEPIRAGRKNHTIRADRKIPIKAGDLLYLYCGLRHKGAFRIISHPVLCTRVLNIRIEISIGDDLVFVGGEQLNRDEMERLAQADGFSSWDDMADFWKANHGVTRKCGPDGWITRCVDFSGQIIHWKGKTQ